MTPFHDHLDEGVIKQPFLFKHLQYICPENLIGGTGDRTGNREQGSNQDN